MSETIKDVLPSGYIMVTVMQRTGEELQTVTKLFTNVNEFLSFDSNLYIKELERAKSLPPQ